MFMSLSLKENNQDVINQAIRELQNFSNLNVSPALVDIPAGYVVGNATGAAANALPVSPLVARSSSLLNLESFTPVGDANYSILPTDRVINNTATFTATRTWTFPLVSSVNSGHRIKFISVGADPTLAFNLVLACQGSDLFYFESTIQVLSSITLNSIQNSFEAIAFNNGAGSTFWSLNFATDKDWINFSPSPVWSGGGPTATITTNVARFSQRGTTVAWSLNLSIGAAGSTGAYITFTAPPGASAPRYSQGGGGRSNTVGKGLGVIVGPGAGGCALNPADASAFPNSDTIVASGTYECT